MTDLTEFFKDKVIEAILLDEDEIPENYMFAQEYEYVLIRFTDGTELRLYGQDIRISSQELDKVQKEQESVAREKRIAALYAQIAKEQAAGLT